MTRKRTGDRLVALFGKRVSRSARAHLLSHGLREPGRREDHALCRGFRYAARAKPARVIRWISRTMVSSALPCGNSVSLMADRRRSRRCRQSRDPRGAPARRSWRGGRMIRSRPSGSWIRRLCHPRICEPLRRPPAARAPRSTRAKGSVHLGHDAAVHMTQPRQDEELADLDFHAGCHHSYAWARAINRDV